MLLVLLRWFESGKVRWTMYDNYALDRVEHGFSFTRLLFNRKIASRDCTDLVVIRGRLAGRQGISQINLNDMTVSQCLSTVLEVGYATDSREFYLFSAKDKTDVRGQSNERLRLKD